MIIVQVREGGEYYGREGGGEGDVGGRCVDRARSGLCATMDARFGGVLKLARVRHIRYF